MEWSERGLVLGLRRHGENSVILEAMTSAHGRHLGVVRGGRSRAHQPVLQPGNEVELFWRARLEEQLGQYRVEPLRLRTDLVLRDPRHLHGVNWLAALLRLLPEREPHPGLYDRAAVLLDQLGAPLAPALFVHFELALLGALGFGLALESCALSGATEDLAYVSPNTGRAASREAGAPWAEKLLPLPEFVVSSALLAPSRENLLDGLKLSGFFLQRHIFAPRGLAAPDARAAFIALL